MITDAVTLTPYPADVYTTSPEVALPLSSMFPNISFYWRMCMTLHKAAGLAKQGRLDSDNWIRASVSIRDALEKCGTKIRIEGMEHIKSLAGPCVFVANHMSTLETFLLPGIIRPLLPFVFVVKDSLARYPVFRHVMNSRDPIIVARNDPRADFTTVMREGVALLERGVSVLIFPQSTRLRYLDRQRFNSMGVKLAKKAGVPIMPVALRTDAWGMGGLFGLLKDHGPIRPEIPVHFRFGSALSIVGNGKDEHEAIYGFIESALEEWGIPPQTPPALPEPQ